MAYHRQNWTNVAGDMMLITNEDQKFIYIGLPPFQTQIVVEPGSTRVWYNCSSVIPYEQGTYQRCESCQTKKTVDNDAKKRGTYICINKQPLSKFYNFHFGPFYLYSLNSYKYNKLLKEAKNTSSDSKMKHLQNELNEKNAEIDKLLAIINKKNEDIKYLQKELNDKNVRIEQLENRVYPDTYNNNINENDLNTKLRRCRDIYEFIYLKEIYQTIKLCESNTILLNCMEMHEKHPNTFFIPSIEYIKKIIVNKSLIRLRVESECGEYKYESFWVIVTDIKKDNDANDGSMIFEGRINNVLVDKHGFNSDDIIQFKQKHIMDCHLKSNDGDGMKYQRLKEDYIKNNMQFDIKQLGGNLTQCKPEVNVTMEFVDETILNKKQFSGFNFNLEQTIEDKNDETNIFSALNDENKSDNSNAFQSIFGDLKWDFGTNENDKKNDETKDNKVDAITDWGNFDWNNDS